LASITKIKHKNGSVSYRVNWRVGDSKDGKRRQEYKTFDNHEAARAHRRAVEKDIESRRVGGPKQQTLHAYLDGWIKEIERKAERGDLSPSTVDGYRRNIGIAKRHLTDQRLSRLSRSSLNGAYDKAIEGGLSKQTVVHVHRVLHSALADAVTDKLISENPAALATPPKVQGRKYRRKVRAFTKDEVERQLHLAQTDKRYETDTYLIALMLAICGPRRGELAGLAFDATDFEGAKVSIFRNVLLVNEEVIVREVPKTDASVRTIAVPAALVELLKQQRKRVLETALKWGKDYQREPLYVFPGPGGAAMNPKLITRRMERLAIRAGIDMTHISPVHSWRHTSGSLLWAATKDVKAVQERLGHSTPQITMELYVHNAPTADEAAADILGELIRR
jgi:integrase